MSYKVTIQKQIPYYNHPKKKKKCMLKEKIRRNKSVPGWASISMPKPCIGPYFSKVFDYNYNQFDH